MTNLEKAQRRVKKLLYIRECLDFIEAQQKQTVPTVNTLLPGDENEEPFFVVHEIDWSQYGRIK